MQPPYNDPTQCLNEWYLHWSPGPKCLPHDTLAATLAYNVLNTSRHGLQCDQHATLTLPPAEQGLLVYATAATPSDCYSWSAALCLLLMLQICWLSYM